jgi:threonine dehydrogenase-like Zn-dependent dehydrogenase
MKALVLNENQGLELRDIPKPKICRDNEALIRVKATGICGTDIHILMGEYSAKTGIPLGHESSGVVEEIGAKVTNVKPGERVILDPTYFCGICFYCQNDRPNYCGEKSNTETGVSHGGTYAEYHVVDSNFLHHLPDEMSFETATLAEPLACVINALRQTRIKPESRVLVVGTGPMGLLFALATKSMGCEVTVGDISNYRIKQAKLLFQKVQDYRETKLLSLNPKKSFDLVIDTSGRALEELIEVVDRGGDILVIGLDYSYEAKINPSYLTDNGIRIVGSIDSNKTFYAAIKMLQQVKDFEKIVTHTFPIDEYKMAFQTLGLDFRSLQRGEILGNKVVICPE